MPVFALPVRVILFTLAALLPAGCSPSHHVIVQQGPPPAGTELPLRFMFNLPITDVQIGDETAALVVDLGGHDTLTLQPHAIEHLTTVRTTGKRSISSDARGRMTSNRQIIVLEMRIGGIVLCDVEGHEFDFEIPDELAAQIDGYLGAAVLMHFSLLVDYPDRIVLYPQGTYPAGFDESQWISLPLDAARRSPAQLEGSSITAGWDTGASHTLISRKHAKRLGGEDDRVSATLTLGDRDFGPLEMRVHPLRGPGVDVLIGHDFFTRHRVFFDFAAGAVWIENG